MRARSLAPGTRPSDGPERPDWTRDQAGQAIGPEDVGSAMNRTRLRRALVMAMPSYTLNRQARYSLASACNFNRGIFYVCRSFRGARVPRLRTAGPPPSGPQ